MIGQEQTITVANDAKLILPAYDYDSNMELNEDTEEYIRNSIHSIHTIGWPGVTSLFATSGIIIQALDERTARVNLVLDVFNARSALAVHAAIYTRIGFTLIIDQTTFLCPVDHPIMVAAAAAADSLDAIGMEVA